MSHFQRCALVGDLVNVIFGQLLAAAIACLSSTVPTKRGNFFKVGGFVPPETADRQHVRISDYNMFKAKPQPRFRFCRDTTFPDAKDLLYD